MRALEAVRGSVGLVLMIGVAACGANGPLELPSAPGVGVASEHARSLLGTWLLVSLQEAGRPTTEIADPKSFQAEFQADGRLRLVADCNACSGAYTAGEGQLSVTPMACTRAACPSMPLDTTYTALVSSATGWAATTNRLELRSSAGTVRFRR